MPVVVVTGMRQTGKTTFAGFNLIEEPDPAALRLTAAKPTA
jgi:predicted AAA+ superfamily ATPase